MYFVVFRDMEVVLFVAGCFCVFHSQESLQYIQRSLDQTLLLASVHDSMTSTQQQQQQSVTDASARTPFQGLPIVLVLAHNPQLSDSGLQLLRDDGQALADRLQCPFVDVPSSMMPAAADTSQRYHADQLQLAMHSLLHCIRHRSALFVKPTQMADSLEPDIR